MPPLGEPIIPWDEKKWGSSFAGKRVHIIGTSPSLKLGFMGKEPREIWGCTGLWESVPVLHRWFEIHTPYIECNTGYTQWMKDFARCPDCQGEGVPGCERCNGYGGGELYMLPARKDIPGSLSYPLAEFSKVFGTLPTSTIAYMMGLAILGGAGAIGVYGVHMNMGTEYVAQRECMIGLIQYARALGTPVYFPPGINLLDTKLYSHYAAIPHDGYRPPKDDPFWQDKRPYWEQQGETENGSQPAHSLLVGD